MQLIAKRIARRVVPYGRRLQVRELFNRCTWRLYRGDAVECNCCETSFRRFQHWVGDDGTVLPMCPRCGALGRHRAYWLFLAQRPELLETPLRVLHVAPEQCIRRRLEHRPGVDYLSGDLDSAQVDVRVDVMSLQFADESFDAVICNHVLEHVEDDRRAIAELHRVTRRGGWAMIQVPFDPARAETVEDPTVVDPKLREELFGQHDHVRAYGVDYPSRLAAGGFEVTTVDAAAELSPESVRRLGLEAREPVFLARRGA